MSLPPPQPAYIFRGHAAQIHSTAFMRSNSRLVTGDADGWIVIWSLDIKRPVAVWKAHEGAILGTSAWGKDKIITHGKDNKLIVWKSSEEDEASMSKMLPVDISPEPRRQPWVLHILDVNTMNFCSFAQCDSSSTSDEPSTSELLIAVPNTMSSETVDIFHLPSSQRIHTIPNPPSLKGGMIMSLSIFHHPISKNLTVISGYESGHTTVSHLLSAHPTPVWKTLYLSHPHTQPLLSLYPSPDFTFYLTSSADAIISRHPIPFSDELIIGSEKEREAEKILKTGHSGQQDLKIRSDGKIFATAGWDGRIRVYGCKGMKELAVLKWHSEGVYAVAFAEVRDKEGQESGEEVGKELVGRSIGVKEQRIKRAREAHWLAAGSKDGKVSLWDVY